MSEGNRYKDIEELYDDKLGFELQLNKLRSEISTINMYLNISRTALLAQPLVEPSLQRLFSKGIVEEDIIELANSLSEKSNCADGDVDSGRTNIDKQSLVSGLQKHGGGIKSTIQELNQQADKLRNQVHELQGQKQGLVEQNQKMLSIIAYSDPVVKFLQGSDHSFSNDNDNVKILATIAFTLYILYFHYGGIKRLADDDDLNKLFVRLSRAFAAGGEESVSIREVKPAVAKVLDALIAKLNSYKLQANEDIALDVIRDCVSNGSDLPTNSKLEGMSS